MTIMRAYDLPDACFEGVIPSMLATCAADGTPNFTWLSQVFRVDARHVALSCQFFRKTRENLDVDPRAQLLVVDPVTVRQFRLDLRFARRETEGPVFEQMARRIQAAASLTQTESVFALRSADVFEVMMATEVEVSVGAPAPPPARAPVPDPLTALARIAEGIAGCRGFEALVQSGLTYLTLHLQLDTVSLYLAEPSEQTLYALASQGYPRSGVGARVAYGVGVVGVVAARRMPVRIADVARELRYGRVVREQVERATGEPEREVPLPGLEGVASLLAVPLVVDGELFGVLGTESARRLAYDERDLQLLQTAGNLLAQALARSLERGKDGSTEDDARDASEPSPAPEPGDAVVRVRYYEADDSVFIDGEYLIKGLPGRILWLLLELREREGRDTFLNRELRLHPLLKLPGYKDNLEARLLMLQRRLQDKNCPLRITREQRGRLTLSCAARITRDLASPAISES